MRASRAIAASLREHLTTTHSPMYTVTRHYIARYRFKPVTFPTAYVGRSRYLWIARLLSIRRASQWSKQTHKTISLTFVSEETKQQTNTHK